MSAAYLPRLTDDERRAMLDDVPEFGRVTNKGERIVLDFYPDLKGGERYLQSFVGERFASDADAERVRRAICRDTKSMSLREAVARYRSSRSKSAGAAATFAAFFKAVESDSWQSERSGRFLAPRTVKAYKAVLRRMEPFCEGMTFGQLLEAKTLRSLKAWFRQPKPQGRGLKSDQEARNAFAALRSVVRWYRIQHTDFPAPDWPSMPTAATAKRENTAERNENRLTLAQTVAGLDAIPKDRAPIFWAMLYTQSRPTEARAVLGTDWERPTLTVRRSAASSSPTAEINDRTKTGERGSWVLPEWLCDEIERECRHVRFSQRLPLFRNPDPRAKGDLFSYDALSDTWRAASTKADIPWVPPYRAFKHGIVTAYRDAGMSVDEIVDQCRFKGDAMVQVYDLRANERRSGVVVKLDEMVDKARGKQ